MKKQKLKSLALNKTSISNLESGQVTGGGFTYEADGTCNVDCNLNTERRRCGAPNATNAYNCTVDSIAVSNCGLTQCQSAGACA